MKIPLRRREIEDDVEEVDETLIELFMKQL
jgi:hypothetical protein